MHAFLPALPAHRTFALSQPLTLLSLEPPSSPSPDLRDFLVDDPPVMCADFSMVDLVFYFFPSLVWVFPSLFGKSDGQKEHVLSLSVAFTNVFFFR